MRRALARLTPGSSAAPSLPQLPSTGARACATEAAAAGGAAADYLAAGGPARTRFAPSPTGMLHLGGLRTALFNYLLAKRTGGQFLLRIEDTDQARLVPGALESIMHGLQWCGLEWDEGPDPAAPWSKSRGAAGPYIQSQRTDVYRSVADALVESGAAYRCFCSAERLDQVRAVQARRGTAVMYDRRCASLPAAEAEARAAAGEPHVVRLRVPYGSAAAAAVGSPLAREAAARGTVVVEDEVLGSVPFALAGMDDAVLLKSDGFPTYHLASVVDDQAMGITHVIRGQEWLASLPKHVLLHDALTQTGALAASGASVVGEPRIPAFAHLALLLNPDRSKLSKRKGALPIDSLGGEGYSPEAVTNFVALLGWHPGSGETQEIFDLQELTQAFSLAGVHKANAVVDPVKLAWINGEHLRRAVRAGRLEQVLPGASASLLATLGLAAREGQANEHQQHHRETQEAVAAREALLVDPLIASGPMGPILWSVPGTDGALPPLTEPLDALWVQTQARSTDTSSDAETVSRWLARVFADPASAAFAAAWGSGGLVTEGAAPAPVLAAERMEAGVVAQHERARFATDLGPLLAPLVLPPPLLVGVSGGSQEGAADFERAWQPGADALLRALLERWEALPADAWTSDERVQADVVGAIKAVIKAAGAAAAAAGDAEGEGKKGRRARVPVSRLMLPVRWSLTGQLAGASLGTLMRLLGREACLFRVRRALWLVEAAQQ